MVHAFVYLFVVYHLSGFEDLAVHATPPVLRGCLQELLVPSQAEESLFAMYMYICVCMYIYIYIYAYAYLYLSIYVYICIYIYTHISIIAHLGFSWVWRSVVQIHRLKAKGTVSLAGILSDLEECQTWSIEPCSEEAYQINATAIVLVKTFVYKMWGSRFAKRKHVDPLKLCFVRCPDLANLGLSQTLDWKLPESHEGKRPYFQALSVPGAEQLQKLLSVGP